jgi:hypothetical protein
MESNKPNSLLIKEAAEQLDNINSKEPDMARAITMLIGHVNGTYLDKYAKGIDSGIDTKAMLYGDDGKPINQYQIARYLQRYITQGSKKSNLLVDLFKMCHYALFDVVRRIKSGELDQTEPRV